MLYVITEFSLGSLCSPEQRLREKRRKPLKVSEEMGIWMPRLRPLGPRGPAREGFRIYAERRSGDRKVPLPFFGNKVGGRQVPVGPPSLDTGARQAVAAARDFVNPNQQTGRGQVAEFVTAAAKPGKP